MTQPHIYRHLTSIQTLVVLATLCFGGMALAAPQSEADLRKENQALTAQVKQAQDELALVRSQMADLQKQIAALQQQLAAARAGKPIATAVPLEEPPVSIDESVASASPRAMLKAVIADYNTTFASTPYDPSGDERAQVAHLRDLRAWVLRVNREQRASVTWHARVLDLSRDSGMYIARVMAVDPQTGTELGRAFEVELSRSQSDRVKNLAVDGDQTVVILKGVLEPQIMVNEDRLVRGTFDTPPFVGPMTEFGFRFDVQGIFAVDAAGSPATKNAEKAPSSNTGGTSPTPSSPPAQPTSPGKP